MINKKNTGSFYTPKIIADFLVARLSEKMKKLSSITILEPSAGDGVFVKSILNNQSLSKNVKSLTAVEREKEELNKINAATNDKRLNTVNIDFLKFQKNNDSKYTLVIGNPPYIKKSLLEADQIVLCKEIHISSGLSNNEIKNIWTAFFVRSIEFVNESGFLAFVLPAELLQVKYASELRTLLQIHFERIEIFTFNELLFKETNAKGQDTLLLIAERKSSSKGIYYCNISKVDDLSTNNFNLAQNISIKDSKWMHHHLISEELELLDRVDKQLKRVNDYCSSKAGIVTAANDYFIVSKSIVEEFGLKKYIKPIIQKGFFVNGSVIIGRKEFNELVRNEKPAFLIALNENSKFRSNQKIARYLELGEGLEIDKRYKTSIRDKWYEVPNISKPAQGFFFKRCNEYPKLIKNKAKLLVTDSAYMVEMKESYSIEHLIFSFYNSLTLSLAELNGRYYGGGVLELTPNEFKNLPLPFSKINNNKFKEYIDSFKSKDSIKEVCKKNDYAILKSVDKNLDIEQIDKLFEIREKLYLRRTKKD